MAKKPNKKLAPKKTTSKKPARAPAKTAAKATQPKRPAKPAIAEHRIAVASVAVHVRYGHGRAEEFELRGTATLNVGAPENIVRTTGLVRLASNAGAKEAGTLAYNPASLNRNLVLTLAIEDADLALLREIFVTGTGSELSDPALTVWATTAAPLAPDAAADAAVLEFGYSLDFDPGPPVGPR